MLEGASDATQMPVRFDPWALQPYRTALELIDILNDEKSATSLLPKVLRGIGRSDGIAEALNTNDLVLRVKKSEEYDIEIVKLFPLAEFTLSIDKSSGDSLIETVPRTLLLSHEGSEARVKLNLDLIETLVRLADGLDPASQELAPLLEELLPFKSRVQRFSTQRVLIIEGGRKHWISRKQGKLVHTNA